MIKNFFENTKVFLKNLRAGRMWRWLMLGIAYASLLAMILILFFTVRSILDGATADKSIHFDETNKLTYTVHLNDGNPYDAKTLDMGSYPEFVREHTDFIEVVPSYTAALSKEVDMSYKAVYTVTLIGRENRGSNPNSNPILWQKEYTPLQPVEGAFSDGNKKINGQGFKLKLEDYENILKTEFIDVTPNVKVMGEIVVTADVRLTNKEKGVNTSMVRAMTVPLNREVFKIDFSGKDISSVDIPERTVKAPTFGQAVWIAIGVGVSLALFIVSSRAGLRGKDDYTNNLRRLLRKYGGEVAQAVAAPDTYGMKIVELKKFDELLKFALNMGKPIVCYSTDKASIFYLICDGYCYQYAMHRTYAELQGFKDFKV